MTDDQKANAEIVDLKSTINDLVKQLENRTAERDLLAIMLNEAENAHRINDFDSRFNRERQHAAGEFEHDPAKTPANRRMTVAHVLNLIQELSPEDREQLKKHLSA